MAIDPNIKTNDVGKSERLREPDTGLDQNDTAAISNAADRVSDLQGAGLRAAGNELTQDGMDNVQLAQAIPFFMPRLGPIARPGMPFDSIPMRPSVPLGHEISPMAKPKDKWDTKGMHGEKQDGLVTPGTEDNRNPDLSPEELDEAYESGKWRGDKMRNQNNRRNEKKNHPRNRSVPGLWERFKNWLNSPGPTPPDYDLIA